MSLFDYPYAYEDRDVVHTSRWVLSGVRTGESGANIAYGRVWATMSDSSDTVTVNLYKDPAAASGDLVATGTANIAAIATTAAKCTLAASNSSGLTGEFYFESYTSDPDDPVEVLVSLAMDSDLVVEHLNLPCLPGWDATEGMAKWLAAATKQVLLRVGQLYSDTLGGHGAPVSRFKLSASRTRPDYRMLAQPDQLMEATVHWAIMLAMGTSDERSVATMYNTLRDYHDGKRKEAMDSWNLTLNTDPDTDEDADQSESASAVSITRL